MSINGQFGRTGNSFLLAYNAVSSDGVTRIKIIDPPAIGTPLTDLNNGAMWVTLMDRNNKSQVIPDWDSVPMLYNGGDIDYNKDTGIITNYTGLSTGRYGATFWFQQGELQLEDTVEFTVSNGMVVIAPKPTGI